jgi:hypothetical protein
MAMKLLGNAAFFLVATCIIIAGCKITGQAVSTASSEEVLQAALAHKDYQEIAGKYPGMKLAASMLMTPLDVQRKVAQLEAGPDAPMAASYKDLPKKDLYELRFVDSTGMKEFVMILDPMTKAMVRDYLWHRINVAMGDSTEKPR